MTSLRLIMFCLAGALAYCSLALLAQPAPGPASGAAKSPVAFFRQLLAMSPEERKKAIASKPPEIQNRILEKLEEYEILPVELRELRLRETELRWYLRPLMDEPRTNRVARLALIPEDERKLVEERLQSWDLLPPSLQEEWTNDETVANYFAQTAPEERTNLLRIIPPDQQARLREGFDRWNQMTEDQRQKALAGFNKIFEVKPEEKEAALDTVHSDEERQQMEKTLDEYGKLSPQQRLQCIRSFEKFATMSVSERQQFLKNAQRWNSMTSEERAKWRQLVTVAPIMPQMENRSAPANLPVRTLRSTSPAMATN